jgi:hypothetical protein
MIWKQTRKKNKILVGVSNSMTSRCSWKLSFALSPNVWIAIQSKAHVPSSRVCHTPRKCLCHGMVISAAHDFSSSSSDTHHESAILTWLKKTCILELAERTTWPLLNIVHRVSEIQENKCLSKTLALIILNTCNTQSDIRNSTILETNLFATLITLRIHYQTIDH